MLGTTGLLGEYGLGRWAGSGPMGAFDKILRGKGLRFGRVLGAYPVLAALGILMFYGIVTGWVVRYLVASISGAYFGISPTPRLRAWIGSSRATTATRPSPARRSCWKRFSRPNDVCAEPGGTPNFYGFGSAG